MDNTSNVISNQSDPCEMAKLIAYDKPIRIVYILECIVGLVVIFINTQALYVLFKLRVFHTNLRLILANLTCNLAIYSMATSLKAFRRLIDDVCNLSILLKSCLLQEFITTIPLHNTLVTLIILSLERLYATIRFRTYDFSGSVPYLGIFLLICGWSITLLMNIPNYFQIHQDYLIPICEVGLFIPAKTLITVACLAFIMEITAIIITTLVFLYNRYVLNHTAINRALYSLSARFQVNQNVQVNKALLPGMLLHMLIYIPAYIGLSLVFLRDESTVSISTKLWSLHLSLLWRLLYALMDPIILITMNPSLRQAMKKTVMGKLMMGIFGKIGGWYGRREVKENPNMEWMRMMQTHFEFLERAWQGKQTGSNRPAECKTVKVAFE